MFKKRLITTLLLTPLVLLLIFYANSLVIAAVILLLGLLCGLEWIALVPLKSIFCRMLFMLALLGMIGLIYILSPLDWWMGIGLTIWAAIVLSVLFFPQSQKIWGYRGNVALMGLILLPVFMHSLLALYHQTQGKDLVVYLLCIVWMSDIGAYLVGKYYGQHRLIPAVSPGKTWEGGLGGFILAFAAALIGHIYFQQYKLVPWITLAMVVIITAMFGDLAISMLKRRVHLKDTGNLLPGHGGMLDRLDSLLFAGPCFYVGVRFLTL
ncbi:MAG: phosphatidate cytidylyltransferase [Legionella sp.]|nr:phosphatidate cytidylyltransferase [Legionella sp.]